MFPRNSVIFAFVFAVAYVSAAAVAGLGNTLGRRAPAQVVTHCTVPGTAALTFDDGPYIYLNEISDALSAAGANGTFFFNGNNFGCIYNEDLAQRIKYAFDKGHQVASHTWSHFHLNTLNLDQIHVQFWLVEEALFKITGAYVAFTRPPFGEYNDVVREVAGLRGQTISNWDFDSRDSAGLGGAASNQAYANLIASHPLSISALNHEVHEQTARVIVPFVIKALQDAGYRLVTLADCLGLPPYQWVDAPQERDASWTCQGRV